MHRPTPLVWLASLLLTVPATGQIVPGDTVRIRAWSTAGTTVGVVEAFGPTEMTIRTAAGSTPVGLAGVTELRKVTGTRSHLGTGIWAGALAGALMSDLIPGDQSISPASRDGRYLLGTIAGAALGGVIGRSRRATRWEVVSLTTVRPEPLPGTRVRLRDGQGGGILAEGSLISLTTDTVAVQTSDGAVRFGRDRLSAIESPWRYRRATKKGALIGTGIGLVAGAALGAASASQDCTGCYELFEPGAVVYLSAILGAGAGILIGSGIGALSRQTDWERIGPDRDDRKIALQVTPVVTGSRVGFRATIGF